MAHLFYHPFIGVFACLRFISFNVMRFLSVIVLMNLCGCSPVPNTSAYQSFYAHLHKNHHPQSSVNFCSDYFLVILVDACHLDYTDNHSFFRTVAKHPSGCKAGDVGHAWIYLQGLQNGKAFCLEGGHSGESGLLQARYFDGMMNYMDSGYANTSFKQRAVCRYEPDPVKYLWEVQHDGFFQLGAGGHRPNYAAKVDLNEEQYRTILSCIETYAYHEYSLIENQCSSFVAKIAALAGLELDCEITIHIDPSVNVGGRMLRLWTNPYYSSLTVSSPDILERSLIQAVEEGRAEYALDWYLSICPEPWREKIRKCGMNAIRFPRRFNRYLQIY